RNPEENYTWDEKQWRDKFKNRMLVPPPFTLNLPLKEVTLAEMLKGQGYTTAITGKWHVASHYKEYNGWNPDYGPSKQGFDWTADTFGEFKPSSEENITDKGTFPPDELTNKAIEFLRKDHQQPFFLYVSHYLVHAPLGKRIKWLIDKYKHKAKSSESEQKITYAAFVELMDHYVGQLLDAIDEAGLSKNTLVICTSDNGGMPEFAYNRPLRGSKWNLYEGGVRIPMILRWPGKVSEGAICTSPVIQTDFMRTFYEIAGGGSIKKVGIDGLSIVPLLNGNGSFEFEKRILVWHFPYYHPEGMKYGKAPDSIGMEDGYISKTTPQSSIRKGKFKLIYFYETARSELYDLQDDPAEQHDVSSILQQESEEMKKELFSYLSRVKARLPKRNI
ncbi:MAG: sulfatase-like hydrolase/transferase, partial [Chitinophagaceae bacterium]